MQKDKILPIFIWLLKAVFALTKVWREKSKLKYYSSKKMPYPTVKASKK